MVNTHREKKEKREEMDGRMNDLRVMIEEIVEGECVLCCVVLIGNGICEGVEGGM